MREMRRREFITLLGGAVATWPSIAGAQRPGRPARLGILLYSNPQTDTTAAERLARPRLHRGAKSSH
jgi:hypothetical protein